jgi:hypothetical protein
MPEQAVKSDTSTESLPENMPQADNANHTAGDLRAYAVLYRIAAAFAPSRFMYSWLGSMRGP